MSVFSNFFYILLVLHLLSALHSAEADDCNDQPRCSRRGPPIRFPFGFKHNQHQNCSSYPGFDVYCSNGDTMLDFPISINLKVKKIDYTSQRIYLSDPQNCLARKFQDLNLSSSPFQFVTDNSNNNNGDGYTIFYCSDSKRDLQYYVPCLSSGSTYQFYAVPNSSYMDSVSLTNCTSYHDVPSVPSYVFAKNDVEMTWSEPACGANCEALGKFCAASNVSTTKVICVNKPPSDKGSFFPLPCARCC